MPIKTARIHQRSAQHALPDGLYLFAADITDTAAVQIEYGGLRWFVAGGGRHVLDLFAAQRAYSAATGGPTLAMVVVPWEDLVAVPVGDLAVV